jgi:zinc D-Ala-D-Ala carboxypeptidase
VPSHRADTPTDAPTVLASRPAAHPSQQRRRDLRGHGRTSSPRTHAPSDGPAWLEAADASRPARPSAQHAVASLSRRQAHARARTGGSTALLDRELDSNSGSLSSFGVPALDPLFLPRQEPTEPVALVPEPRAPRTPPRVEVPPSEPAHEPLPSQFLADFLSDFPSVFPAAPDQTVPGAPATDPARRSGKAGARRNGVKLPQVGIAGALGLATIAVPLTGAFAVAPPVKEAANTVSTAALAPLPPFPLTTVPARTALDDVRLLPDEEPNASVPARLAAPRTLLVGRASRSNQRAVLPGCDGHVPDVSGIPNGQLPASMLCTLWDPSRQLRSDAAVAIAKLNLAYQQHFGHPMCFNDAYRSLAAQYQVKAERGSFAARPGTSEHGWGLAVDLCDGIEQGSSSVTYQWMRGNAPLYGWDNPTWARPGGSGPYEPWHWEYLLGEKGQSSAD